MKIATVLGTRPEIIRLSRIIPLLDTLADHILIHTGQNFDERLSKIFFEDLELRRPDHFLGCAGGTTMQQVARIFEACERILDAEKPDRLLVLGDTNSGLSSLVAKRMGIPVYHMEAGNRCYSDVVPEEVNRRVIDHTSDVLMPYTERSRMNLRREGLPSNAIYVTGNPILEVIEYYRAQIESSPALDLMGLKSGAYCLATLHRSENVDNEGRLSGIFDGLRRVCQQLSMPLVVSLHPHTEKRMRQMDMEIADSGVTISPPFGFFDFVKLESAAALVLTDSGTVQEECCLLKVPTVTIREVTERPETLECGSNVLAGTTAVGILEGVRLALQKGRSWEPPQEYTRTNVSQTVTSIMLSGASN